MPRVANTAKTARPNKQINATIPGALYAALDDHRWSARIDGMTKLNTQAVGEYAHRNGLRFDGDAEFYQSIGLEPLPEVPADEAK